MKQWLVAQGAEGVYVDAALSVIYSYGCTEDNALVVVMCVKFVIENRPTSRHGILFVANACEEGLGNLKGTKAVMAVEGIYFI